MVANGRADASQSIGQVMELPGAASASDRSWRAPLAVSSLVAVLTLPALWPLLRPGFFQSDDGMFHLYRLAALDEALHAGVLLPRWFPDFAFGYGFPVLNFYSPLSYYLAELFHLLVGDLVVDLKLAFAASLVLSAVAIYVFARGWLGRAGAALAALAYLYGPYHLTDVYRRGALAESLAFVFFPLILWLCDRVVETRRWRDAALLAVAAAGLVLTHNLSALLLAPLAAAYVVFRWWGSGDPARDLRPGAPGGAFRRRSVAGLVVAAGLLAAGLSAFYTLPVLTESRYAYLSNDYNGAGYVRHLAPLDGMVSPWPVYQYFPDQGGSAERPLGLAQAILAAASLVVLVARIRRRQEWRHLAFWWMAFLTSLVMTLQVSLPVWQMLQPVLSMVQYPWRFMALADLSAAFLIGSLLPVRGEAPARSAWGRWRTLALGAAALALMANALPGLPRPSLPLTGGDVTVDRMWKADYDAGQIGATWTAEFLPLTVGEERWAIPRAPAQAEAQAALPADVRVRLGEQGLLHSEFQTDSAGGFPLRLHAFYFPGWRGVVDGQAVAAYPSGTLGLVTVDVPAGQHRVRIEFGDTVVRQAGTVLSALSLVLVLAVLVAPTAALAGRWARAVVAVGAVVVAVLAGAHFWPGSTAAVTPVGADLEGSVQLLGSRVDAARGYPPGEALRVDLYWMAKRMLPEYKVFVHVVDAAGVVRAQHDGDPGGGFTPTTRWLPGEVVKDSHTVSLPDGLAPGTYTILAGMYGFETMKNLAARDETGNSLPDGRAPVGRVTVVGR